MTEPPRQARRVGRPARINRATIVTAARSVLEAEGLDALTMRRLAREVGRAPMALYHHVSSRSELLTAVLSVQAGEIPRPKLPADPRDRMVAVACHLHGALAEVPWVMEVLSHGEGVGVPALWISDEFLASARDWGATPERALHMFRSIWHYIIGELTHRFHARRRKTDPELPDDWRASVGETDLVDVPTLRAMLPEWDRLSASYDVSVAITELIDGMLAVTRPEGRTSI
ncbi:TetR/AcrR family transcriptional regulator [Actinoalloteichus sp. GBA129-24]|uniref:TetR/AcrR family transcriptional regulator n=1 Tax=Actinoalloteichus sp. GBA129-24 TaxID=1612551 RepID=UPI000952B4AA|nr:TetR/AcrR family transcriptional regulator [Actinoalloteichus sp. GBA129-24]